MFYYAKAYFRLYFSFGSLVPFLYWPVVKNLPSIFATRSEGEADFQSGAQTKCLRRNEILGLLQGDEYLRVPEGLTLWSRGDGLGEKVCASLRCSS